MPFKHLGAEKSVLLIAAIFVLYLKYNEKLNLYIHPRYIFFTTVMSALGLLVIALSLKGKKKLESHDASKLSSLPLVLVLIVAILIPARSLSSATVSQRSIDSGSLVTTTDAKPVSSLFAGSSKGLKLSDWYRLLQTNSDPNYYANKPAKISGFVYNNDLGDDTAWLARFVLTCCAVDAQPVGVAVQIEGWQNTYEQDEWIEVEGQFKEMDTAKGTQLVLIPDSVSRIDQPRNPYAN